MIKPFKTGIEIKNISKSFNSDARGRVDALKDVTVSFPKNAISFVTGPSGSGKSTLLNVLGGLLTPDSGSLRVGETEFDLQSPNEKRKMRSSLVSLVFQDYNILDNFTVLDNVMMVGEKNKKKALEILERVGLLELLKKKARFLSGGEKQRVAIARALASDSPIILLDEPTGNLDSGNSDSIMELLRNLSSEKTIIVVTHDETLISRFGDFHARMRDGEIESIQEVNSGNASVIENKDEGQEDDEIAKSEENKLGARFSFKYAAKMFFGNGLRNTFALLSCFVMAFFSVMVSSFAFYDLPRVYWDVASSDIAGITAVNRETFGQTINVPEGGFRIGQKVYDDLNSTGLPFFTSIWYSCFFNAESESESFDLYIVRSDKAFNFEGQAITPPEYGKVLVSPKALEIFENGSHDGISMQGINADYFLDSGDYEFPLSLPIESDTIKRLEIEEQNKGIVFVTEETVVDFCDDPNMKFILSFNENLYPTQPNITDDCAIPSKANGQELVAGDYPKNADEMALSEEWAIKVKEQLGLYSIEYLVGQRLTVRDLPFAESNLETTAIFKEVRISGIVKADSPETIIVNDEAFKKCVKHMLTHLDFFRASIESLEDMRKLYEVGLSPACSTPEYLKAQEIKSKMMPNEMVLLGVMILAALLAVFINVIVSYATTKEKVKDIALFHSLGIPSSKIFSLYSFGNVFISVLSVVAALVASIVLLIPLSQLLVQPLSIPTLLVVGWPVILVSIILAIVTALGSSVLAAVKIYSMDPSEANKNF